MMLYDARIIQYETVRFGGEHFLWTALKLHPASIPAGLYHYTMESRSKTKELYQLVEGAADDKRHAATILSGSDLFWARSFPVLLHPKEAPEFTGQRITLRQFAMQQGLQVKDPDQPPILQPAGGMELKAMFYTRDADAIEAACVGHLRGDFGSSGSHFYTTWWPHNDDCLNTPVFKEEFNALINYLREDGMLSNRSAMYEFVSHAADCELGSDRREYGFIARSEHYQYFIRCNPNPGDYNCYVIAMTSSCWIRHCRRREHDESAHEKAPHESKASPPQSAANRLSRMRGRHPAGDRRRGV